MIDFSEFVDEYYECKGYHIEYHSIINDRLFFIVVVGVVGSLFFPF